MSNVPLPVASWRAAGGAHLDRFTRKQLEAYGDARAAEARKLALLEAAKLAEPLALADRLRALAQQQ